MAQLTLSSPQDIAPAWGAATRALREGSTVGMNELYALGTQTQWLVEEIVPGSTDGWYAEPGYGDYVSVEGIVADGVYHPLCITGRLPPVPPLG